MSTRGRLFAPGRRVLRGKGEGLFIVMDAERFGSPQERASKTLNKAFGKPAQKGDPGDV